MYLYTKELKPKKYYYDGITKIDYDKYICSDVSYTFPIFKNEVIRECTRYERITIYKLIDEIHDGEYIENGEIKTVEKPKNLIKPRWNKHTNIWEESATKEELMNLRKEKILKYAELKKEIETLEEFAGEFESDGTIELLKLQMQELKGDIDELLQIIKKM